MSIVQEYKGLKENLRAVSLCILKTVRARENAIQRDGDANVTNTSHGIWFPTFRESVVVSSSSV